MKLPLFLLFSAALLSLGALRLDAIEHSQAVAPAQRAQQRPRATENANTPPHSLNVRDVSALAPVSSAPLFRPAQTPAALDVPQPGQTFALTGVAGAGESRVAFLRDEADQQTLRGRAGEDVRGWRIERLDERCITLTRARQRQTACLS